LELPFPGEQLGRPVGERDSHDGKITEQGPLPLPKTWDFVLMICFLIFVSIQGVKTWHISACGGL
jgi:hypothetical protein